jgi:hypothetical protein
MLPSSFWWDFEGKQHSMVILAAEWGSDKDWSRVLVLAATSWEIRHIMFDEHSMVTGI